MDKDFDKDDLLGRWLGGTLSKDEEKALRAWEDFSEYERLARESSELSISDFDPKTALARLKVKRNMGAAAGATKVVEQGPSAKIRPLHRRPRLYYGIAAALLLLLSLWYFLPTDQRIYSAPLATTETAELPDGSTLRLNAASTAHWTETGEERHIALQGEAFFEVEKDGRTFVVTTDFGEVTVIGTSFNVYARNGSLRVNCRTGKVRVSFTGQATTHLLEAGQSVAQEQGARPATASFSTEEATDWLDNRSVFNDRPLSEILAELERQFALNISTPPSLDQNQLFRTAFPHQSADQALEIVLSLLPEMRYERREKDVLISRK